MQAEMQYLQERQWCLAKIGMPNSTDMSLPMASTRSLSIAPALLLSMMTELLLSIPFMGRKHFYDTRHSSNNADRALTTTELADPKIAGTRGHSYFSSSDLPAIQITVPGSAPYNWYKKS